MKPKFRAWRKNAQKMVNVSSLDWKIDENEKESLHAIWWYSTQNALVSSADVVSDDFILMQSTGLKDKKGKEIFEGDVVRIFDEKLSKIYYSDGAFCVDILNGGTPLHAFLSEQLEVIGNIVDSAGSEMIGKVTGKAIVDGKHTLDCGIYGKFLVTEELYDSVQVGDEIPNELRGWK